jgi:type II pantothenate kinase
MDGAASNKFKRLQDFLTNFPCFIGLDLGGSLIKVAVLRSADDMHWSNIFTEIFSLIELNGLLDLIQDLPKRHTVCITGGGAVKHRSAFVERWSCHQLEFADEMLCLVLGVDFSCPGAEPSLLVNVGSGVSIIEIIGSSGAYSRISGSCIGGGTYMGLMNLVMGRTIKFEEAVDISKAGNHKKCDMLVRDIYGSSVPGMPELDSDLIASSLGKLDSHSEQADVASSALSLVIISIAHVAALNSALYPNRQLVFSGGFFSDEKGTGLVFIV